MSFNPFDRKCYGWHCGEKDDCKHYLLPASHKIQYFMPVLPGDVCPFHEHPSSWGEGPEGVE